MNRVSVIVFLALIVVAASFFFEDRDYNINGFKRSYHGIHAPYNNAARQKAVNGLAEQTGASRGTAKYYGVPGTGNYFHEVNRVYPPHYG